MRRTGDGRFESYPHPCQPTIASEIGFSLVQPVATTQLNGALPLDLKGSKDDLTYSREAAETQGKNIIPD
jgi:hypothetical protein